MTTAPFVGGRRLVLAASLSVVLTSVSAMSASGSIVLDFNNLVHGQIVDNEYVISNGVTISGDNVNIPGSPDWVVAFDTFRNPTNDPDLEDPFDVGNAATNTNWPDLVDPNIPSNWSQTASRFRRALIIQEKNVGADANNDGFLDDPNGVGGPDDEGRRPAGSIFFDFNSPISEIGFDLLDIEGPSEFGANAGYVATFLFNGNVLGQVGFGDLINSSSPFYDSTIVFGNNSANRVSPITAAELGGTSFNRVEFNFGGSGAVDNIAYKLYNPPGGDPIPEASSMIVWALLGMTVGCFPRRFQGAI